MLDVDGVLTTGNFFYTIDGKIMKDCWFHPQSGEILTPFGIAINEVVTGTKSAEKAMTQATAKINKAIGA